MLEAGWNKVCDRLVYVHAPRAQRLARVAAQRGWTAKEVDARASAQMPLTDKVSRADDVIDNSRSPALNRVSWGVPGRLSRRAAFPGADVTGCSTPSEICARFPTG